MLSARISTCPNWTSTSSPTDPDIGIFLHGKGRTAAEVRVAFRCDFDPERPRDWPEIPSLCPPLAGEMFSVPLHRFCKWLETRTADTSGDVEGELVEAESTQPHRKRRTKFLLCGGHDKSEVLSDPADIFPDSVILPPAPRDKDEMVEVRKLGQVLGHGFGTEKVDVWERALLHAGKTPALRVNRAVLAPWLAHCLRGPMSGISGCPSRFPSAVSAARDRSNASKRRAELRARGVEAIFSAQRIQVGKPPLRKINFNLATAC